MAERHVRDGAQGVIVAKEDWIDEPADAGDGWLVHANEPDARETAIRGLIASTC